MNVDQVKRHSIGGSEFQLPQYLNETGRVKDLFLRENSKEESAAGDV